MICKHTQYYKYDFYSSFGLRTSKQVVIIRANGEDDIVASCYLKNTVWFLFLLFLFDLFMHSVNFRFSSLEILITLVIWYSLELWK